MHPKTHYKVDGKLFAVVMDRPNTTTSFSFKEAFPGLILDSATTCFALVVPGK